MSNSRREPHFGKKAPDTRDLGLGFGLSPVAGVSIDELDAELVASCHGLQAWLSVIANEEGAEIVSRLDRVRREQPARATAAREHAEEGLLRYAYHIADTDGEGRRTNTVRGFVFSRMGHVELVAHASGEAGVETAFELLAAIGIDASTWIDAAIERASEVDPFSLSRYLMSPAAGTNAYTLHDAVSGGILLEGREPELGVGVGLLRVLGRRRFLTRFKVVLRGVDGAVALTLRRGFARPVSMVDVLDSRGKLLGQIKPRLWTIFPTHDLLDADGGRVARLRISWPSGNARVDRDGVEIARFTRAAAGIFATGNESDELWIAPDLSDEGPLRRMLIATAIYLDVRRKD